MSFITAEGVSFSWGQARILARGSPRVRERENLSASSAPTEAAKARF